MNRIRPILVTLFVAAAVVSAFVTPLSARADNPAAVKPLQSGYAAANGVNYHHRIYA